MNRKFVLLIAVTAAVWSLPAKSELLWSDGCDVRQRIQTFIRKQMPTDCTWPKPNPDVQTACRRMRDDGLFGYEELRRHAARPATIAFEMVIHVDNACFSKLDARVRSLVKARTVIISTRKASDLFSKFDADGGPTLIFYFRAEARELRDVDRQFFH